MKLVLQNIDINQQKLKTFKDALLEIKASKEGVKEFYRSFKKISFYSGGGYSYISKINDAIRDYEKFLDKKVDQITKELEILQEKNKEKIRQAFGIKKQIGE